MGDRGPFLQKSKGTEEIEAARQSEKEHFEKFETTARFNTDYTEISASS
jgi:hypothetical protein